MSDLTTSRGLLKRKSGELKNVLSKVKVFEEVDFASRLKAVLRIPGTGMLIESRQRCDAL